MNSLTIASEILSGTSGNDDNKLLVDGNVWLGCNIWHMTWQTCTWCKDKRKYEAKQYLAEALKQKKTTRTIRKFDPTSQTPVIKKIDDDGWGLSAKCLKRRFVNDSKRRLPVKGQGDLEDFNFSNLAVLDFAKHMELKQNSAGLGYYEGTLCPFNTFKSEKLKIASFAIADDTKDQYLQEIESICREQFANENGVVNLEEMINKHYIKAELMHKNVENHHPDGTFCPSVWSTFEVCVDVFMSIYAQTPRYDRAWRVWCNAMANEKFSKLEPRGIYYFLLYVQKYGISYSRITNRAGELVDTDLFYTMSEVYYDATVDHILAVNSVLRLARCPLRHDWSKFDPNQFIPYMFKWTLVESGKANIHCVYDMNTGVYETRKQWDQKFRMVEGLKTSLTEKLSDGAASVGKKIFGESLHKLDDLTDKATTTIEGAKQAVRGMVNKFQSMLSSFSPIAELAKTFTSTIVTWFNQFKINVKDFGVISYTYLFSLYLVYINSENALIKTACIFLIFDKLGLTTAISRVVMGSTGDDDIDDEETESETTDETFEEAQEDVNDTDEIKKPKFDEIQVVTDGRCMYHALAILLNYNKEDGETVSNWIDRFMSEILLIESLTDHEIESIVKREYGTDIILQKIAQHYKYDIITVEDYQLETERMTSLNEGFPKLYIRYSNLHWTPLIPIVEGEKTTAPEIVQFVLKLITEGFSLAVLPTLASVIGVFFLGKLISPHHYKDLGEWVTTTMKNFHFVGGGLLGIERVLKYSTEILKNVFIWVRVNIFGITEEKLTIEKRVHKLVTKASFFSTSAGIGVIKADVRCREIAASLFSEYLDLANSINVNPNCISKDALILFRRSEKNIQSVYNLCHRISQTSGFRPTAYHVQFVGQPGIGKTTLLKKFSHHICKELYSMDCDPNNMPIYSYNPNVDFWSGYSSQKLVIIDDIFRMNDPKHMSLLIGIITNAPISLPMPNLEDKETMFESDILISTTNTPYPQVKDLYCIEAVYRRRHMLVKVECDPDCYDKQKGQVDIKKVLTKYGIQESQLNETLPHLTFRMMRPIPNSGIENSDLPTYLADIEDQKDGLKKAMQQIKMLNKQSLASFGSLSENYKTALYLEQSSKEMKDAKLTRIFKTYNFKELFQEFKAKVILAKQYERDLSCEEKKLKIFDCWTEFDQQFVSDSGVDPINWKKHFCDLVFETPGLLSPDQDDMKAANDILKHPLTELHPILEDLGEETLIGETTSLTLEQEAKRRERILQAKNRDIKKSRYSQKLLTMVGDDILIEDHPGTGIDSTKVLVEGDFAMQQQGITQAKLMSLMEFHMVDQRPISTSKGSLSVHFLSNIKYETSQGFTRYLYCPPKLIKKHRFIISVHGHRRWGSAVELYAIHETYKRYASIFMNLPDSERKRLVDKSKNYVVLFGTNPFHAINQAINDSIQGCSKLVQNFKDVLEWSFDQFKKKWKQMICILTFAGIIYAARSMASLVLGTTTSTKPSHNIQKAHVVWGTKTSKLMIDQFIEGVAENNVISFQIETKNGMTSSGHGFKEGQFLITVGHAIPDDPFIITFPPTIKHPDGWSHPVERYQIAKSPRGDKALIFLPTTSFARSNISHFFLRSDIEKYDPFNRTSYLIKNVGNTRTIIPRSPQQPTKNLHFRDCADGYTFISDAGLMLSDTGIKGDSGATFIIENPEAAGLRVIYGIQSFSPKDGGTYIQSVTQEDFQELRSQIEQQCIEAHERKPVLQMGPVISVYEDGDVVSGEGTSARAAKLVTEHVLPVYSIHNKFIVGQVGKSKFKESPIAQQMRISGFESKRCPAAFKFDHVTQIDPLAHSLNKSGRHIVGPWNMKLLKIARQGICAHFKALLPDKHYRTDLTPAEIVEGLRIDGCNPMATNTSPGIPYIFTRPAGVKGKHDLMEMQECGEALLNSKFIMEFEQFYFDLSCGVIPYHTSYDFPKDELRPIEKAKTKTRLVTTLNVCITMSWRRVLSELMSDLHVLARGDTPFAPGMNPMGPDWTTMYHYLNKFDSAVDFDVNNWDGHFPPELAYECAHLLCDLIAVEKNSPEGNVIYSIITEVLFGHVQFRDMIYQKQRGLQSGFPGTAELNTIAHMILDLYIYLFIMTDRCPHLANIESYFVFVRTKIYGDDIIKSISKFILEYYNGDSIASVYVVHGYPVSSADKDSEIRTFKPLMECQFLKSKFRPLSTARVERLIEWSTIHDLCYWYRSNFQGEEQFRQNLLDAARFVHPYGAKTFNAWLANLNRWLKKAHQPPLIVTWETLEAEYVSNNYSTHSVLKEHHQPRGAIAYLPL